MSEEPEEPAPLQYASVEPEGDEFRVVITHPYYNGGAPIAVTGYRDEESANEGARWWDERMIATPPDELHDMGGPVHVRAD